MSQYVVKKVTSPIPLSCIFHICLFILLAIAGSSIEFQEEGYSPTVIELEALPIEAVEITQEELLEREESGIASGDQAPLAASEATALGDGAVAAGKGNPFVSKGGGAPVAGNTGRGIGSIKNTDSRFGSVTSTKVMSKPAESAESIDSIASRFASRVEANKKYPHMALKRNQQGVAVVSVTIASDGSLFECGIAASSGVSSLDKAAVQAVERSCPFSHGAGRSVSFSVPIHFILN